MMISAKNHFNWKLLWICSQYGDIESDTPPMHTHTHPRTHTHTEDIWRYGNQEKKANIPLKKRIKRFFFNLRLSWDSAVMPDLWPLTCESKGRRRGARCPLVPSPSSTAGVGVVVVRGKGGGGGVLEGGLNGASERNTRQIVEALSRYTRWGGTTQSSGTLCKSIFCLLVCSIEKKKKDCSGTACRTDLKDVFFFSFFIHWYYLYYNHKRNKE